MTEWRNYNEKYLVSDDGQVRHVNSENIRKLNRPNGKYLYCHMRINGKNCMVTVHRMVAAVFIGPRPDGTQIRHLDGDPTNNRVENLAYGTAKENAADRERHGNTKRGAKNGNAKLPDADADFIRLIYAAKKATQYELAALFHISQAQVYNIVRNKQRLRAA